MELIRSNPTSIRFTSDASAPTYSIMVFTIDSLRAVPPYPTVFPTRSDGLVMFLSFKESTMLNGDCTIAPMDLIFVP